jgi:hypothetical protein
VVFILLFVCSLVVVVSLLESDLLKKFCHAVDRENRVGLDVGSSVGVVSADVWEITLLSESSDSIEDIERSSEWSGMSVCVVGSGIEVPLRTFLG